MKSNGQGRRRILICLILAVSHAGCGYILRGITGEDTPRCKPKCSKAETCQWEWVECSGPFGGSCTHSERSVCR